MGGIELVDVEEMRRIGCDDFWTSMFLEDLKPKSPENPPPRWFLDCWLDAVGLNHRSPVMTVASM